MQESIFKFLESEKSLLWVKTYDYTEVENAISTGLEKLENKKFFVYEAGKTVNKFTGETLATEDLFNTLDELYPQGIRKVPIFLLIKDSLEEILKKSNLDYIKEILDTKKANPKYNFTLIIADVEEVPTQISKDAEFINKEKNINIIENEAKIEEYILDIIKLEGLEVNSKEILDTIVKDFKRSIGKILRNEIKTESSNSNLKLDNMVYVKGGKYEAFPKTGNIGSEKSDLLVREVFDLEVGKYPVTQKLYQEIMGNNPSYFNGERMEKENGNSIKKNYGKDLERPVESVGWWTALDFCNKLSKKYNLEPVYDLSKKNEGILMINQLNGNKSYPDEADFKDTEGFRLPTEIEWMWFASGGEKGNRSNPYAGSININEVAWYERNSNNQTHKVGLKKPNSLGIFDCSGNVREWCYDTHDNRYSSDKKLYTYRAFDSTLNTRVTKGGSFRESHPNNREEYLTCRILDSIQCDVHFEPPMNMFFGFIKSEPENKLCGFRIVRTVNR